MTPQAAPSTAVAPACATVLQPEPVPVARLHAALVAAGFGVLRVADTFVVLGAGAIRWCESPEQLRRCALGLGVDLES